MDHGTLRQLAAGAALDDLDPAERRAFDEHVARCIGCAALAGDLGEVLGELAFATPGLAPPPGLRADVMSALRRADEGTTGLAPAGTPRDVRALAARYGRRPRSSTMWAVAGLAMAAVLVIAVIGLGARTVQLDGDMSVARTRIAEQAAAMAVVVDPTHRTARLAAEAEAPEATAVVVYRPGTREAFIMADHLPATPDGMVYQLWSADAGGVHPLGTFRYDGAGTFLAPFGVDLGAAVAAMLTLEPVGGSAGEPGPQAVFGRL